MPPNRIHRSDLRTENGNIGNSHSQPGLNALEESITFLNASKYQAQERDFCVKPPSIKIRGRTRQRKSNPPCDPRVSSMANQWLALLVYAQEGPIHSFGDEFDVAMYEHSTRSDSSRGATDTTHANRRLYLLREAAVDQVDFTYERARERKAVENISQRRKSPSTLL